MFLAVAPSQATCRRRSLWPTGARQCRRHITGLEGRDYFFDFWSSLSKGWQSCPRFCRLVPAGQGAVGLLGFFRSGMRSEPHEGVPGGLAPLPPAELAAPEPLPAEPLGVWALACDERRAAVMPSTRTANVIREFVM
jgi:hypothetical protein